MSQGFVTLKTKRLEAGFTLADMSDRLNISKTYYYHIENGTRRLSYFMAVEISDIFNTKPDILFYEDLKNLG